MTMPAAHPTPLVRAERADPRAAALAPLGVAERYAEEWAHACAVQRAAALPAPPRPDRVRVRAPIA